MPIQLVNLGSSALAGNGDSLYSAFSKVNDNFNELYFLTQQALENAFTSTSTVVFDYGSFSAPTSAFPLQVRRGTNASRATIIPSQGELVYATDIKRLYIGDGVTPGGNVVLGTIGYTGSAGFGNTITNHLIPSVTGSYDLGSTSGQWRSLFVSSSTIFVNNTPVTVSNGQIIVNGNTVTGSLLFNQTQIIGDGGVSNLGSVQLVPNTLLTSNGQYVIVRPTIALDQTHIHMQAGNPDTADLYLGDDDRYVKIDHNGPVEIGASTGYLTAVFTSTSSVVDAATISIDKTANVWANELTFGDRIDIGTSSIYINTISELEPSILTIFFTAGSLASYTTGTAITFTYKQRKTWKFQNNGGLTFPDGTTQTTAFISGGAATTSTLYNGTYTVSLSNLGNLTLPISRSIQATEADDLASLKLNYEDAEVIFGDLRDQDAILASPAVRSWQGMPSYQAYPLITAFNGTPSVLVSLIPVANNASQQYQYYQQKLSETRVGIIAGTSTWALRANGGLSFPDGTTQTTAFISGVAVSTSTLRSGTYTVSLSTTGNLTIPSVIRGINPQGVIIGSNYNTYIISDYSDNNRTWTFDGTGGDTTFPNGTIISDDGSGNTQLRVPAITTGTYKEFTFHNDGRLQLGNTIGYIYTNAPMGQVIIADYLGPDGSPSAPSTVLTLGGIDIFKISSGPPAVHWTFKDNGSIEFPDGTTQTTAYGLVAPPISSTSTGITGMLAKDATYFYVCTATNAWQRIQWDSTPW